MMHRVLFWMGVALVIAAYGCAAKPPRAEADAAENAFVAAKEAAPCAPIAYASAEKALADARTFMRQKKYEEAKRYFAVAKEKSEEAQKQAAANTDCKPKPDVPPALTPVAGSGEAPVLSEGLSPKDIGFELKTVYFAFNSDELSADSKTTLERNATWMKNFSATKVVLEGHADKRGSTEYNLSLGERRASAVRKYLTILQVNPDNLEVVSYGSERPARDEDNEEAYSLNRRVEFRKAN